jgi:hypothetical protein
LRSNQNRVHHGAKLMRVTAGGMSCDPTRLTSRSRQSTIEGHSAFCDNKRTPRDNPFVKSLVNLRALIGQNAVSYSDPRVSQLHNPFARVTRIYINRTDNHISDSRLKYRMCARTGASFCGARFQSNVKRGSSRHRRGEIAEAFNLGVLAAGPSMMSSRHDPVTDDENRANRGVRASLTERLLCLVERGTHELFVSFSIHRFETSIVVLTRRGNASAQPSAH